MSEEEFDELLDLMSEQNLTRHGADKLYGEIVSREIERRTLKEKLQQKENIIKEVREWAKKCSCQFTNDDGELVVSEISFNIQARPCDLFKILDKVD